MLGPDTNDPLTAWFWHSGMLGSLSAGLRSAARRPELNGVRLYFGAEDTGERLACVLVNGEPDNVLTQILRQLSWPTPVPGAMVQIYLLLVRREA